MFDGPSNNYIAFGIFYHDLLFKLYPDGNIDLVAPLKIASGGTGTATPALTAGSNISITGTWPANTIAVASSPSFSGISGSTLQLSSLGGALKIGSAGSVAADMLQLSNNSAAVGASKFSSLGTRGDTISGINGTLFNLADAGVASLVAFDLNGNLGLAGTLQLGTPLAVAYGGTGAASFAAAGLPQIVANVDLTGQTTAISGTTIYTTPAAGFYRASGMLILTATGTGGTITGVMVATLAGSSTTIPMTAGMPAAGSPNYGQGSIVFYADSGTPIKYGVQFSGVTGSPTYDFHVRLEKM